MREIIRGGKKLEGLYDERALSDTHHTALAIQIRVNLLLERGLIHITRANGNADGRGLLLGLARDVLPDGDRRVDATTLLEERADGATRALGRNEDDVDVRRRHDFGVLLVYDGEAVREVERLALGDERRELGPRRGLGGIRKQVHDDRPSLDRLLDREERFAGYPAVLHCLLPALAVFAHADDDVEAVVARVEALAVALRAVADEGERVIFEVVMQPGKRPIAALVDNLWGASKVERLHTADGLQGPTKKKIQRWSLRDEGNFRVKRNEPRRTLLLDVARWLCGLSASRATSSWPVLRFGPCGGHGEKQREGLVRSEMRRRP